eukprot:scaffold76971_cov14-Tisochrysis_lutea.AAC.1
MHHAIVLGRGRALVPSRKRHLVAATAEKQAADALLSILFHLGGLYLHKRRNSVYCKSSLPGCKGPLWLYDV